MRTRATLWIIVTVVLCLASFVVGRSSNSWDATTNSHEVPTTPSSPPRDFDDGYRFIFYAVMEGCYEDGLSSNDVSQILLRDPKSKYYYSHFVYACPVCTPTIHALEAYQSRPSYWYSLKTTWGEKHEAPTFGPGLTPDLKTQLYSEKPEDRLAAINTLMKGWVSKRMSLLKLSNQERTELQNTLEEMRKKGMGYLKGFEKGAQSQYPVSAFVNVHQCAVCNGACGLNLKPDAGKIGLTYARHHSAP